MKHIKPDRQCQHLSDMIALFHSGAGFSGFSADMQKDDSLWEDLHQKQIY